MEIQYDKKGYSFLKLYADTSKFPDKFFIDETVTRDGKEVVPFFYNMEPFDSFPSEEDFLNKFIEECKKVFKDIGEEHIDNIFYIIRSCTINGVPYAIPRHLKKIQLKQAKELFEFIKLKEQFINQTSFEELTTIVDFNTLNYCMSSVGFDKGKYTKTQLKELNTSVFNNEAIPINLKKGKDLLIHFNGKIKLCFGEKQLDVDNAGCFMHVVKYHVTHLVDEQKKYETPFYKTLLMNTERPNVKMLESALNDMKVITKNEKYLNEGIKALILEISEYLNKNTKLILTINRGKSQKNGVTSAIPKEMKVFIFNLLLLIGVINEHNNSPKAGYEFWEDYLKRKESFKNSKSLEREVNAIDRIMRSKLIKL